MTEQRDRHWPTTDRDGAWEDIASFVVCVERGANAAGSTLRTIIAGPTATHRTDVHHLESGEHGAWPGIALHEACRFMVQQVQSQASTRIPGHHDAAPAGMNAWSIERISLTQAPDRLPQPLVEPHAMHSGYVESHSPFGLLVQMRNACPDGMPAPADAHWDIAVDAQDTRSWTIVRLAMVSGCMDDIERAGYACAIVSRPLAPGLYRLRVVLHWSDASMEEAAVEVPLLEVG